MSSVFSTNVKGKVNEIKLDSKYGYQALFEVISNAIYSIEQTNDKNGKITINIERDEIIQTDITIPLEELQKRACVKNITVIDNGEGFTQDNFDSFMTCYSEHKHEQGGKGIGRFTCLKVFKYVAVKSVFGDEERYVREFDFYPLNELQNEKELVQTDSERFTAIKLMNIKTNYADKFPTDLTRLAELIIEHFFINFITNKVPIIEINDEFQGKINVNDYYINNEKQEVVKERFDIYDRSFFIYHVKADINKSNNVYLCANLRATETKIDLRKFIQNLQSNILSDDGKKKWYYAYITADYLDSIVNSERIELIFPHEDKYGGGITDISFDTFKQKVVDVISNYLKKDLELIESKKRQQIDNYINNIEPKYRMLREHKPELYSNIPNGLSDSKLGLALYQEQQNWEMEITKKGHELFSGAKKYDPSKIEQLKEEYLKGITDIGKSCLTEYIVKRKAILDVFDNALMQDSESKKYSLEEVVHKLICPMISTSDELNYDDMNLWLIDESLAYHYYLASDKAITSQRPIQNSSTKETDLAIYHASLTFNNTPLDVPFSALTIVEFKRPMRDNYDAKDNPIQQVKEYIRLIRAGRAKDRNGRPITGNLGDLPIYVYIIADITSSLGKQCEDDDFTMTPDKEGYYRYHGSLKAYIEVISYNKLYRNASQRNKILFDKLFSPKI